jgi:hypothetical protein
MINLVIEYSKMEYEKKGTGFWSWLIRRPRVAGNLQIVRKKTERIALPLK